MHTTMTEKMHKNCNGFVGYKTAPHNDCTETGIHAAEMTLKTLEKGIVARSAWVRVPILIAGEKSESSSQPMVTLINKLRELEKIEGVMAASYLMGFPWADNKDSSVAVYVVTEDNQDLANDLAVELGELIWSKRNDFKFVTEAYSQEEAWDKALEGVEKGDRPIYISDSGDNPTAGATSDSTNLLKLLISDKRIRKLEEPIIYGGIYDPEATKKCKGRLGEKISLEFGAKFDRETSSPIKVEGRVRSYIEDWSIGSFP